MSCSMENERSSCDTTLPSGLTLPGASPWTRGRDQKSRAEALVRTFTGRSSGFIVELKKLKHLNPKKMSNTVSSIISRHGQPDSLGYRIMLADGSMHVKTEVEVRCMVRGDIAIESYDPHLPIQNERAEPVCMNAGPRQGDVLLVRIDDCRAACKVLEVGNKRGRPLYTVEYDDGMLVQDHLVVPR